MLVQRAAVMIPKLKTNGERIIAIPISEASQYSHLPRPLANPSTNETIRTAPPSIKLAQSAVGLFEYLKKYGAAIRTAPKIPVIQYIIIHLLSVVYLPRLLLHLLLWDGESQEDDWVVRRRYTVLNLHFRC